MRECWENRNGVRQNVSALGRTVSACRRVCANVAEAWRKRRYQASFVAKLNDAETEAAETQVHVEIAFRHGYITQNVFAELDDACDKILAQIVRMIDHADRWVTPIRRYGSSAPTRFSRCLYAFLTACTRWAMESLASPYNISQFCL